MLALIITLLAAAKLLLAHLLVLGSVGSALSLALDLLCVLVVLGAGMLLPRPGARYAWLLAWDAALSALMLATVVYASYFEQVMGAAAFRLTGQAGELGNAIAGLLHPVHLLFLVDLPVLVWLAARASRRERASGRRMGWKRRLAAAVALLATAVLLAANVRAIASDPGTLDGLTVSQERGVFVYQLATAFHKERPALAVKHADGAPHPERASWVVSAIAKLKGASAEPSRLYGTRRGAAKDANVIVIQVEALQDAIVGKRIDGTAVTPNLDALIDESWYFPQTFSQIAGGNTSDAEFISNTSLYPPADDAASVADAGKTLPGLPRILGRLGYQSATFHVNDASFWNRSQLYPALGFDRYYDKAFFGAEDRIGFGASDQVLFRKGLAELERMHATGRPFYAQFVTVTSHFPFTQLPASKHPYEPPAPYAGTETGRYISAEHYTDEAIGGFIDALKADGLWDSSVIVVYGDHFGMHKLNGKGAEGKAEQALLGHEYTYVDRLNIPLIVHTPGQTAGRTVWRPAGQIDVMPTIADLLGVDLSATPHFGRSLFEGSPVLIGERRYVPAGSVITTDTYLAAGLTTETSKAVPLDARTTSRALSAAEARKLEDVRSLLALSDAYIQELPDRAGYDPNAKARIPNRD